MTMPSQPLADGVARREGWASAVSTMRQDGSWLLAMAAFAALELIWWAIARSHGIAPAPQVGTYVIFACMALAVATLLRTAVRRPPWGTSSMSVVAATFLVAVAASLFLPLKYAIPHEVAFWLDGPLAAAERALFVVDPWLALDRAFGWAALPMDWLYGAWLPVQTVVLFLVILARPSPAKSRALIAYSAAWFLLGVAAAVIFASAGPLFYDRLLGGNEFALLAPTLRARGVWIALAESDGMWASFATGTPGPVAGISAVPSLHVAISLWIWLTARAMAPRSAPFAAVYFLLIWIGSVQLGWHYAADGLAGALGMLAIWLAGRLPLAISATAPIFRQPR
jgi:hypothetical protein